MKNRISAWIVLGIITIVASLSLAVTNEVTKGPIAQQARLSEDKAKMLMFPAADRFEEITLDGGLILFAAKAGDETIGYVGKAERKGYGGMVEVIAGVKPDGTVTGISVGGSGFSETPGLGAKAKDAAFTDQFSGKKTPVKLGDTDGEDTVDAITAATITSSAVIGGVNQIARQVDSYLNPQSSQNVTVTTEGTSYGASADGFAGPVAVIVTVNDSGAITSLVIGDDRFSETDGYGANALAPEFAGQFVGRTLPVKLEDIQAISGATITSKAVVAAINKAWDEKNVVATQSQATEGTVYTGEAEGFAGPVAVEVTIRDDNTIAALKIGDDRFSETEGYGAGALEPSFLAQFTGKILPISLSDVEAVSGATYTSKAVIEAINMAFEKKAAAGETQQPAPSEVPPTEAPPTEAPVAVPEDAVTVTKPGYAGPVAVTISFNADGAIRFIRIGDGQFSETKGFGAKALEKEFQQQFIGKVPPLEIRGADGLAGPGTFDAVASATITSAAVRDAVNEAHASLFPAPTEEPKPGLPAGQPEKSGVTVSKEGFMGPVTVQAVFNPDGTISGIVIGGGQFMETEGYGKAALEESFAASLIGKRPPLTMAESHAAASASEISRIVNVDSVTSSTVTTQAIIDAINEAYASLFPADKPAEEAPGDEVSAVKQGFLGPIAVKVSFNEDNTIAGIVIGDETFMESAGYGAFALEKAYADQFVGKQPPLSIREANEQPALDKVEKIINIDGMTSATVTTQAIIDAINEAFASRQ